jgi:hypothetical protein
MSQIRSFDQLTKALADRASQTKAAATKAAAGDTPTEKDPAEKGTTAIPKDPNATPAVQNLPPQSTNVEVTPVVSISPAKTVGSETKSAGSLSYQALPAGVKRLPRPRLLRTLCPTPATTTRTPPRRRQRPMRPPKSRIPTRLPKMLLVTWLLT